MTRPTARWGPCRARRSCGADAAAAGAGPSPLPAAVSSERHERRAKLARAREITGCYFSGPVQPVLATTISPLALCPSLPLSLSFHPTERARGCLRPTPNCLLSPSNASTPKTITSAPSLPSRRLRVTAPIVRPVTPGRGESGPSKTSAFFAPKKGRRGKQPRAAAAPSTKDPPTSKPSPC